MSSSFNNIQSISGPAEKLSIALKPTVDALEKSLKQAIIVSYTDIQLQQATFATQINALEQRIEVLIKKKDDDLDAATQTNQLAVKQLELENENIRLRIELLKQENNIITHNATDSPAETTEPISDKKQTAIEWIKCHPPYIDTRHGDNEDTDMYYSRYEADHEYPLPAKTFEFIARATIGRTPSCTARVIDNRKVLIRKW